MHNNCSSAFDNVGNVSRWTVTKPVSFRGNVLPHNKRNRITIDDTGIATV